MDSQDIQFLTYGQEEGVDLLASLLETPSISYPDFSEFNFGPSSPLSLGPVLLPPAEAKETSVAGELEDEGFEGENWPLFVPRYCL